MATKKKDPEKTKSAAPPKPTEAAKDKAATANPASGGRPILSPDNKRRLVIGGVLLGGVGIYLYVFDHRAFAKDVRAICSAEAQSETTIVKSRILVETNARKAMTSNDGVALIDAMKMATPESAAKQLHAAADKAGVADCPATVSYELLAKRAPLIHNADQMCRRLLPSKIAEVPRAKRFAFLRDWTRTNINDAAVDDLLASIENDATVDASAGAAATTTTTPLEAKTEKLRAAVSELGIHECGVLTGLGSTLDPVTGPNAFVRSVSLERDPREAAVTTAIKAQAFAFRDCYEEGLRIGLEDAGPHAVPVPKSGTMTLKFRLSEAGTIDFALTQEDSTIRSPIINTCVVAALKNMHGLPTGTTKSPGGLAVVFWVAP